MLGLHSTSASAARLCRSSVAAHSSTGLAMAWLRSANRLGGGGGQIWRRTLSTEGTSKAAVGGALNWEEFFTLRKQRRLWERLAALPCAMLGLGAGAAVFASLPVNPQQMFMGLDPLLVFGGATMFCGVLGFVVGPSVGRVWYRIGNRRLAQSLDFKEAEFFKHVRANRSDPNFSSASNPLPDFYGEKINSLHGYRKWLRKQREHERKGTFSLGNKRK